MESIPSGVDSDDREEGEIVDDDLEDISDNSIIVPFSGKSVSAKEHLPAISLSSVTDVDEPKSENKIRHRHKMSRKKGTKSKRRRNSHRKSTCSDSDSAEYMELDKKLQKQLKAAVRIDETEERHQNSLRSRLKGMTKLDEPESCEPEKTETVEIKDSSDEGDSELAELRLEALRTAVMNKFKHRKKRKLKENNDNDILSDISAKTDNSEMNKENKKIEENCSKKLCVEIPVQNVVSNNIVESTTPPEDDEDVLRALLLASMSKKITSENETRRTTSLLNNGVKNALQVVNNKKETKTVTVNSVTNFRNHLIKKNVVSKNLQLPKVKPLVINVNQDSDSEDDLFQKTKTVSNQVEVGLANADIESSVEKFLKEQRAKVEAQLSPIPKCPVKPSVKPKSPPAILEKSSVKLLSKVKQLEYQKLLLRLKNAEKRPRIRRSSLKFSGDGKPIASTSKKIIRPKLPVNKQANVVKVDKKETSTVSQVDPVASIKSEVRTLHKILKEIQVQRNGRLQIQEKYKLLMPVIKKINEASIERRKWEEGTKRLLQEIAEMKMKLKKSQQAFTTHLNDLIREKSRIDKSMDVKKPEMSEDVRMQFTSTPVKDGLPVIDFRMSSPVLPASNVDKSVAIQTTTPTSNNSATEDKPSDDDLIEAPLNPGDPNDIDKIYSKEKNSFPRYISPLDNVKRVIVDDPFSIVCPYDVDGNCRDPECVYKHLFK